MTGPLGHLGRYPSLADYMAFSIRRLFWFTSFVALYAAVFSLGGFGLIFLSCFFGFGLMIAASFVLGRFKFADVDSIGWDVLYICFALPAVIFLICSPFVP